MITRLATPLDPSRELETVVWCPKCAVEKFRVYRERCGQEGVYRHVQEPKIPDTKRCECGTVLERL
jgi:hypothetical protein